MFCNRFSVWRISAVDRPIEWCRECYFYQFEQKLLITCIEAIEEPGQRRIFVVKFDFFIHFALRYNDMMMDIWAFLWIIVCFAILISILVSKIFQLFPF